MSAITACTLDCPDACSLSVETGRHGEIRISGNPEHPFTRGFACRKISNLPMRLASPNRVIRPLLRDGRGWKPISWTEALDLCAEEIQSRREAPSSVLHIWGSGSKGILQLAPRLFFASLGASTRRGSLCNSAGVAACVEDFGAIDINDSTDLLKSRGIVNWGKDFSRCSVHFTALIRRARKEGAQVVTISPGGDENGRYSDRIIRVRPGTDRYLVAAVIRLLLEEGRIRESVIERTANWPAFKAIIESRALDDLVKACGVSVEDVRYLTDFYSQTGPVATVIGWGLQRYLFGGENVRFINALALLSGNVGRSGGGAGFTVPAHRNFNCSWEMPSNAALQRSFKIAAIGREITEAGNPPVSMAWVNGCNIVNQAPESKLTAGAFEGIGFKVVVDAFMNDTAERADLVLPCTLMLEQEDIVGSSIHNYVNYARKVTEPPGEAKTDHWIISEIGKRLDPSILVPDVEECFRLALDSPYLDTSMEELRTRGFSPAKRKPVAFEGMSFSHPDGKYRFPQSLNPEPPVPSGYPLRLLSLIRKEITHSQILPEDHALKPTAAISAGSPMLKTINRDRAVFLVSPLGRVEVDLILDAELGPGIVIYRRGDWMKLGGGANQLIEAKSTDLGDGAAYYSQHVRLEN
jgi:anaerobic selenocysteine-containing dehydrogenase